MLARYTNAAQADGTYNCGINQAQAEETVLPNKIKSAI
jgi:hypothetical protein